jgi:hypothetical protein
LRRAATLGQSKRILVFIFFLQVIEDIVYDHRVLDARDNPDCPATGPAGLNVDIEYAL